MRKSIIFVLMNIALISCGDNTNSQSESSGSSPVDTSSATQSAPYVDSTRSNIPSRDTSATGNSTPVGATDGSNNTGAVGGSTTSKNSTDTKSVSGTGKTSDGNDGKKKNK